MKFIFSFCLLCSVALCSFAQSDGKLPILTVGAQVAFPVGASSDVYSAGYGASLKCEVPLSPDKVYFTVAAGYERLSYSSEFKNENFIQSSGVGFVPLKAGIKYYPKGGFFVDGQAGIAISTLSGAGVAFAYSPGIGYALSDNLEAAVRYESWSKDGSINQFGLHLAYRFKQ